MPIFSNSSSAMRSSPYVGFCVAIWTISFRNCAGTRGLPRGLDFHFQNRRKPLRCQLINVSGLTMIRASRQSKQRDNRASANRIESVARPGLTLRSTKRPSCFRRNRFSAATAVVGLKQSRIKVKPSRKTPKMVRNKVLKGFHDSILRSHSRAAIYTK